MLNNGVVAKILFSSPLPLSKIIPEVKPQINPFPKKIENFNISLIFLKKIYKNSPLQALQDRERLWVFPITFVWLSTQILGLKK
ncbi:hypothetical protein [Lyngbya sp. CCY1209]|uniref:hypothetical protein n=1 Tax=Lyngbya sp. CCY1209 TaxID=2886103 RepID=UPI002D20B419|nr:hypothetical protein [Lyngbya sp. CCY1209]MEB3886419.1 hypothetical protein [Lyngbya sp. CCY1209]